MNERNDRLYKSAEDNHCCGIGTGAGDDGCADNDSVCRAGGSGSRIGSSVGEGGIENNSSSATVVCGADVGGASVAADDDSGGGGNGGGDLAARTRGGSGGGDDSGSGSGEAQRVSGMLAFATSSISLVVP